MLQWFTKRENWFLTCQYESLIFHHKIVSNQHNLHTLVRELALLITYIITRIHSRQRCGTYAQFRITNHDYHVYNYNKRT